MRTVVRLQQRLITVDCSSPEDCSLPIHEHGSPARDTRVRHVAAAARPIRYRSRADQILIRPSAALSTEGCASHTLGRPPGIGGRIQSQYSSTLHSYATWSLAYQGQGCSSKGYHR
jgi:hypothetical protein